MQSLLFTDDKKNSNYNLHTMATEPLSFYNIQNILINIFNNNGRHHIFSFVTALIIKTFFVRFIESGGRRETIL